MGLIAFLLTSFAVLILLAILTLQVRICDRLDLLIEQGRMRFSDEDNDDTEG